MGSGDKVMNGYLTTLSAFFLLVTSAFAVEQPIQISDGAAILYYNVPAAVRNGDEIDVGYVTSAGDVMVTRLALDGRKIGKVLVHSYGKPDDHSAPALHSIDGEVLIATSFHSSEMMLFGMRGDTIRQICSWKGSYSYPRFDTVNGQLRLYVRSDPNLAGDLAYFENPTDCTEPVTVAKAESGTWLYATPVVDGSAAWAIYTRATNKHTGLHRDDLAIDVPTDHFSQVLPWSVSGNYMAVTQFQETFDCCGKGEYVASLYKDDKPVFSLPPRPIPYYANGIVLSRDGTEALVPSDGGILRMSIPDKAPLESCKGSSDYNVGPQYVAGLPGSYVWMTMKPPFSGKNFATGSIWLCLHEDTSEARARGKIGNELVSGDR